MYTFQINNNYSHLKIILSGEFLNRSFFNLFYSSRKVVFYDMKNYTKTSTN